MCVCVYVCVCALFRLGKLKQLKLHAGGLPAAGLPGDFFSRYDRFHVKYMERVSEEKNVCVVLRLCRSFVLHRFFDEFSSQNSSDMKPGIAHIRVEDSLARSQELLLLTSK